MPVSPDLHSCCVDPCDATALSCVVIIPQVQKAVAAKDEAALKTAWATYFTTAGLDKPNPFKKFDRGQPYSSDFSYYVKNKQW
jgi:hypothetical protein